MAKECVTLSTISSTNHIASPSRCAAELLDTIPLLMRVIRTNVHSQAGAELSMPQFRTLGFLGRHKGAMLADVATFLGLTRPAASKLVDGLVAARFASRVPHLRDRRRVSLALTTSGRRKYELVLATARKFLAGEMRRLPAQERLAVMEAMRVLHGVFADAPDDERS